MNWSVRLLTACLALLPATAPSLVAADPPTPRAVLHGHTNYVLSVAFSPDGKTLASTGQDASVRLWDVATGKERAVLIQREKGFEIWHQAALPFSPDGKTLASGGNEEVIRLWDLATGKERAALHGPKFVGRALAFGPDGKTLASTAEVDGGITLWDLNTLKPRATLECGMISERALSYSPDGKTLASGLVDGTVLLWDTQTERKRATLGGQTRDTVSFVAFAPDGKTLASATSGSRRIRLWSSQTGEELKTLWGSSVSQFSAAFSPDGKYLVVGDDEGAVRWEVETKADHPVYQGKDVWVISVAYSPDGKTLAAACQDQAIRLWDAADVGKAGK